MREKKKLKRLPKSPNGKRRKAASFGCWGYERDDLMAIAHREGYTRSAWINIKLLGATWMDEDKPKKRRRKASKRGGK